MPRAYQRPSAKPAERHGNRVEDETLLHLTVALGTFR
jgi:hypothetical protein